MAETCDVDAYEAGVWWLRAAVVLFLAAVSSGTALPPFPRPAPKLPVAEIVSQTEPEPAPPPTNTPGIRAGVREDAQDTTLPQVPQVPQMPQMSQGAQISQQVPQQISQQVPQQGSQGLVRRGAGIFARPSAPRAREPVRDLRRGISLTGVAPSLRRRNALTPNTAPNIMQTGVALGNQINTPRPPTRPAAAQVSAPTTGVTSGTAQVLRVPPSKLKNITYTL